MGFALTSNCRSFPKRGTLMSLLAEGYPGVIVGRPAEVQIKICPLGIRGIVYMSVHCMTDFHLFTLFNLGLVLFCFLSCSPPAARLPSFS
jgi:hypothetical protein